MKPHIPFATLSLLSFALALSPLSFPSSRVEAMQTTTLTQHMQARLVRRVFNARRRRSLPSTRAVSRRLSSSFSSRSSAASRSTSSLVSRSSQVQLVLELVNKERANNDLPALTLNILLEHSATKHARDMIKRDFFDHVNPDGFSPTQRIKAEGYPQQTCSCSIYYGENIAKGQHTAESVMHDWMNSPGHRAHILSKHYKEIGIAMEDDVWVQNFGGVWGGVIEIGRASCRERVYVLV